MVGTVGSSGSVGTGRQHSARESVQGIFQKRPRTISTNSSIHQPCKYFQITKLVHAYMKYLFMLAAAGMAKVQSLPDFDNISIPSITLSNSGKTDITPIVQDALGVAMEQMGSPASLCSVKVLKSPKQKKKSMELRMTFNPKNDLDMQSEMSHQEMKEVEDFMEDLEESEYQTRSHWSSSQMQPKRTKSQVEREWERRSKFWDSFATTYSLIYGIFLIMAGVVAYTFDLFGPSSKAKFYHVGTIGESFNVYLSVVGIIIICVLMLDIHKYLNSMRSYQNDQNGKFKLIEGEDGELIISVPLVEEHLELPDYYLFTTGRHSGSFFLRIGAAIFCVGHIIHMLVIMVRQIQYFFLPADQVGDLQCTSPVHILSCLLKSIYDFLQLYMIFKYSNVIVNRSKRLARFCFMHCLAASLCLWIHAIMHETVEYVLDGYVSTNHTSGMNDTCTDFDNSCLADRGNFELDIDCLIQKTCVCTSQDQTFGDMFTISAYSFPFTIEFGILTAGVWYVMWSKIGKVAEHHKEASYMPSLEASDEHNKPIHDSLHIFADCSKAIKGIFFGILFFVTGVIGLVVHEVFYMYPDYWYSSIINDLFEGILLLSMISATIYVSLT